MLFSEIVGNDGLKARLRGMVDSGRIAHAQLYTGRAGVGKLPLALAVAQYICCRHRENGEACGKCVSCQQFSKLEHPDLHFVFPIYGSKTVCDDVLPTFRRVMLENAYTTNEEWMAEVSEGKQCVIYSAESEEVMRKLSYKPYESDYKVMIIFGADKMHEVFANKVLKILEEPPGDTIFMLISDTTDNILPTIISRCQQVMVNPVSGDDISSAIKARYDMGDADVAFFSRNAMGSWGRAMSLINESEEMVVHFDLFKDMMRHSYLCNVKLLRQWSEAVSALSRESQIRFLQNAQRLIRENFLLRLEKNDLNYMSAQELEFARRFSAFVHERNIMEIVDILSTAERQIAQNGNAKIILLHTGLMLYGQLRRGREK